MTLTSRSRRFAASVAGASAGLLALGLVAAVPASATTSPAVINPGNVPTTAKGYNNGESCPVMGDEGDDIWHFVAPGKGATFTALLVTFDLDGDAATTGDQITRNLSNAVQHPTAKHAYVSTPAGYTLIDGTATIDGATVTLKNSDIYFFNLSHTCTGGGVITPKSTLSGAKYYDANHNGQRDPGEAGIANWPIDFNGTTIYTNGTGLFSKSDLPNGAYDVSEIQSANTAWMQTGNIVDQSSVTGSATVYLADKQYTVTVSGESTVSGLLFGNVCQLTSSNGKTLGFWSNKNGEALLKADPTWVNALTTYKGTAIVLRNADGTVFTPAAKNYTAFRNWLLNATATNAAYMTSVQMAALLLNIKFFGLNDSDLINIGGSWVSIESAILAANGILTAEGTVMDGNPLRSTLLAHKDAFDDLNNNRATVTPATAAGCPAPFAA